LILLLLCAGALALWQEYAGTGPAFGIRILPSVGTAIACNYPYIIDGDTLDCAGRRIRLASIDAPEMPGHCRPGRTCVSGDPFAAKNQLHALTRGTVSCQPVDTDAYGRIVARCQGPTGDLSCTMVAGGFAIERYGRLQCGAWRL
jgi:endonuclease YncB( thermonuclease family)